MVVRLARLRLCAASRGEGAGLVTAAGVLAAVGGGLDGVEGDVASAALTD